MTTVDAALVVEGLGALPPVWRGGPVLAPSMLWEYLVMRGGSERSSLDWQGCGLDLTDRTTYRECCELLAVWAGDDGTAQAYWLEPASWPGWRLMRAGRGIPVALFWAPAQFIVPSCPEWSMVLPTDHTDALAAILTHIGRDHRIRRALGWTVEPRTLATLEQAADDWDFDCPSGKRLTFYCSGVDNAGPPVRYIPALAGVTDPTEALAAIDAALGPQGG